jgi:hypothetical protein
MTKEFSMTLKRVVCLTLLSTVMTGCWGQRDLLEQSGDKPAWVSSAKESFTETRDGRKLIFYRADLTKVRDLALAKRQARFELVKKIASEVSEEVETAYAGATVTSSNQLDRSFDAGGSIRDAVAAVSSVRLADLRVEESYWERRLYNTDLGTQEAYQVSVLGSVPEDELKRLKIEAFEKGKEVAHQRNDRKAEQQIDDMLHRLKSR